MEPGKQKCRSSGFLSPHTFSAYVCQLKQKAHYCLKYGCKHVQKRCLRQLQYREQERDTIESTLLKLAEIILVESFRES